MIIPNVNQKKFQYYIKLQEYIKFELSLHKNKFIYIHYDANLKNSIIRYIVNTKIIIFHNEHIKNITKNIVSSFKIQYEKWFKNIN